MEIPWLWQDNDIDQSDQSERSNEGWESQLAAKSWLILTITAPEELTLITTIPVYGTLIGVNTWEIILELIRYKIRDSDLQAFIPRRIQLNLLGKYMKF